MSWTQWQRVEGDGLAFDEIVYEKRTHSELGGGVARVTINKPDKLNTMTLHTVDEMFRAFYDANHDPAIGVLVVAGAGKHFGTGGDVEWESWGLREAFYNRYPHNRLIRLSRKPVIAAGAGLLPRRPQPHGLRLRLHDRRRQRHLRPGRAARVEPADGYFVPFLTKVVGARRRARCGCSAGATRRSRRSRWGS
jgi:naphthoate synthase/2-ketocyclohexanecarboxyl-CoA hydrolase